MNPIPNPPSAETAVVPAEVYGRDGAPVKLLIGNGGAGPLGLLRALGEHFLESRGADYAIGWVKAGTGENFALMRQGRIDMALTYEPAVERRLVREGVATAHQLIFHDRFLLVGPTADPAALGERPGDIGDALLRIAEAGARAQGDDSGVRFLSRDDLSATTARERGIWALLQLDPWDDPGAAWYVRYRGFPLEALERASAIGAYTLNDLGTWIAGSARRAGMRIFCRQGAILDNPCSVLVTVPARGAPSPEALDFARYLSSPGARRLIADFGREAYGEALYNVSAPAPPASL